MPKGLDQQGRYETRDDEPCMDAEVYDWIDDNLMADLQFWAITLAGIACYVAVIVFGARAFD